MENKFEGTVHHLQFVDGTFDAEKQELKRQAKNSLFRPTYILKLKSNLQRWQKQ